MNLQFSGFGSIESHDTCYVFLLPLTPTHPALNSVFDAKRLVELDRALREQLKNRLQQQPSLLCQSLS